MLCATRVSIGWDNFTLYHSPKKTDGCRMGRDYRVQEEGKKLVITLEHCTSSGYRVWKFFCLPPRAFVFYSFCYFIKQHLALWPLHTWNIETPEWSNSWLVERNQLNINFFLSFISFFFSLCMYVVVCDAVVVVRERTYLIISYLFDWNCASVPNFVCA